MLSLISNNPERKKRLWHLIDTVSGAKLTTEVIRDFFKHGITKDEDEWLMCNDIDTAIKQLKSNLIWFEDAHPEIQEVLIDMCFNMGINTLLTFKTTLKLMSLHQYPEAAEQMLKSKWAKQVKRRAKELSERVKNIK
jgi:lysozyme